MAANTIRQFLQKKENLPNVLTFSRIAVVPLLIILLSFDGRFINFFTALLIVAAAITDGLDGYLARKYQVITAFGKLLDPVADKVLIVTTMVMLVFLGRAPAWMVCLILCREFAVTGLRAVVAEQGVVIAASPSAKYKTVFQIVAIVALTIHYPLFAINAHSVGMVFIWLALGLTLWTGYAYFKAALPYLSITGE
ncbi:MAG: CDP-diacylglycerol--glycerol-3-phosphate 3-phosphatidyltransferase [Deltaproteobacteria bacterium]|nr:CDP-diacylglycerol--glycerol-3-phosphate 3-phosphatidyltransferase [Candidatus Anaeroferrophillus wilburensis]MBN2888266.1 CDP-diacylglycerol--glycerol-3-phosphate 3-phosphatidyltransferase [Deltaproteobacteria bacterium]